MATVQLPYTPTRGSLASQTFYTKQAYNEALARAKGFSGETEARRAGIGKASTEFNSEDWRLYNKATRVAGRVSRGESLTKAAKAEGIRPETVLKYRAGTFEKHQAGYMAIGPGFQGEGTVWVNVLTPGGADIMAIPRKSDRKMLSRYGNALRKLNSHREGVRVKGREELAKYVGKFVTDADGKRIYLITNEAELKLLAEADELSFEDMYPD